MNPAIVDTNVLVVANGRTQQATPQCVLACIKSLNDIRDRGALVLDDAWRVIREYQQQASSTGEPGVGDAFLKWVLINLANPQRCELVHLLPRADQPDEFVDFPEDPALSGFDRADRKFVALNRACPGHPPIVNATDTDWWTFRDALQRHDVAIRFLCPELMPRRA